MITANPLPLAKIRADYNEVAARPSFFSELSDYQKECVLYYARQQQEELVLEVYYLVNCKPAASYPAWCESEEQKSKYWQEQLPAYAANQKVLELCNAQPATAAEAASTTIVRLPATAKAIASIPASSLRGLALEDVQELFQHPILQSEGDRAAALAILNSQNYLPGSAYSLYDWFATNVGAKVSRRLISASIREIREEGELSKKAQQAAEWVAQWLEAKAKR